MSEQEIKIPMKYFKEVTCNKCKGAVSPSVFEGLFECKTCKSITDQVTAIEAPCIGLLRITYT